MPEPLIQTTGLSSERNGRLLFNNLDMALEPGSVTRVEGPNGAGKTTLLRILAGLASQTSGEVLWQGQPRDAQRELFLSNMLYIGHRPAIKGVMTPMENLAALMGGRQSISRTELEQALVNVGLDAYLNRPCRYLSAGQQRRVALARLLIAKEPLWILDEIFTAIDRQGVGGLEACLQEHADEGGAVLFTTHHEPRIEGMKSLQLTIGEAE